MNNPFEKMIQRYKLGFRQVHEAMCGSASIILASNGLGLAKKQESDWLNSDFAQWMPIEQFSQHGMALHELQFISELIYGKDIDIKIRRSYPENFSLFMHDIKQSFQTLNSVVIVNYRQDDLIDTEPDVLGNPHYSPIVNWDALKEEILIADIDSDIQEPYWVKIEDMFQSMSHLNPTFNLPRGWLVFYKRGHRYALSSCHP